MDLPGEIRNQIYGFILPCNAEIPIRAPPPNLLVAGKQIRQECLPLYYGRNKFILDLPALYARNPIPSFTQHMRKIGFERPHYERGHLLRPQIEAELITSRVPNSINLTICFSDFHLGMSGPRETHRAQLRDWAKVALGPVLDGRQMVEAMRELHRLGWTSRIVLLHAPFAPCWFAEISCEE